MDSIGNLIKKLREDKVLPLRVVAAYLDIDKAIQVETLETEIEKFA